MKRNKPSDLELICGDARFIQDFYGFTNDALCGTPPDQGDICCRCTDQRGKFDGCFDAANLSLPLFHHRAPFGGVGKFIADQHAVFVVLIRCCRMRVTRHTRNRARGYAAFSNFVTFVAVGFTRGIGGNDHLASIDFRIVGESFGIH